MNERAPIGCSEPGVASQGGRCFLIHGVFPNRTRPRPRRRPRSSRINAESFRSDELVKILVVGPGKLVSKILICEPDLTGTDIAFDNKSVKVAFPVIDHGNPADFFKGFFTLPKREVTFRIR